MDELDFSDNVESFQSGTKRATYRGELRQSLTPKSEPADEDTQKTPYGFKIFTSERKKRNKEWMRTKRPIE